MGRSLSRRRRSLHAALGDLPISRDDGVHLRGLALSELDDIGGEAALRRIIDEFVDGCFDDVMIGFLFRNAKRERVKKFEFQHAAKHLGADIEYEGRPIEVAHRAHPILGGHFDRRLTILRTTLDRHGVPEAIRDRWIAHHQSLRAQVTRDPDSRCNHEAAEAKVAEASK